MKKFISLFIALIILVNYCPHFVFESSAKAGGKKSNTKASSSAISLKARDGGNIVYGSVLNAKENEVKAKLTPKQLTAIRKTGLDNVSVSLTKVAKVGEVSSTYTLKPSDSLDLIGKQLVINLVSSLTDSAGSTYTAGALPEGTYQLTITAGDKTINGTFDYKPPTVLVGNVSGKSGTCTGGTEQVNDIAGQSLSRTVALSNCSYFNEVQANRGTKKSRTLLNLASGTSGASTGVSGEVAISEAITPEGILKAAVDLNPDNNGKVKFDITASTTATVNSAQNLIAGDGTTNLTSDEKNALKDALSTSVKSTSVEDSGNQIEAIGNSGSKDDFQFDPACPGKFDALLKGVSPNPSDAELLALGKKILAAIADPNGIGKCVPPFVSKIVDLVKSQGDNGLIAFAQKFIFHTSEEQKQQQGPDPAELCQHFGSDIKRMKAQCPQCSLPCIPDQIKELLNKVCQDVVALFGKCQDSPVACGFGGPGSGQFPGGPGGFPGGPGGFTGGPQGPGGTTQPGVKTQIANNNDQGSEGCIQFRPPAHPCQPCDKLGDKCISGKPAENCPGKNFPSGICKQVNDADGKPAVDDAGKPRLLCVLDSAPINAFNCEEDKFFDLNQQCVPAPANSCIIDPDTGTFLTNTVSGPSGPVQSNRFDKRCCGFGGPGGPGEGSGFGGPGPNNFGRIAYQIAPTGSQGGPGGGFGGPLPPECQDPTFAKLNPGKCQPFGDNNFQPPPSNFGPPPECKNLEFAKANPDKCLPFPQGGPQGGGQFPEPGGFSGGQFGPQGQFGEGGGKHGRSLDACIRQELCTNIGSNFESGPFGKVKQDIYNTILAKCKDEASSVNDNGPRQCPPEQKFDPNTQKCVGQNPDQNPGQCPQGQKFDPTTQKCIGQNPGGNSSSGSPSSSSSGGSSTTSSSSSGGSNSSGSPSSSSSSGSSSTTSSSSSSGSSGKQ